MLAMEGLASSGAALSESMILMRLHTFSLALPSALDAGGKHEIKACSVF
jgi:hypothetical protein